MFESAAHYAASELSETVSGVTTTLTWSGGSGSGNTVPGEHPVGCSGPAAMGPAARVDRYHRWYRHLHAARGQSGVAKKPCPISPVRSL
jgi:hypothetical protein